MDDEKTLDFVAIAKEDLRVLKIPTPSDQAVLYIAHLLDELYMSSPEHRQELNQYWDSLEANNDKEV